MDGSHVLDQEEVMRMGYDGFLIRGSSKVHAGHLETVIVHLLCKPRRSWVIDTDLIPVDSPVTCKRCLAILEKQGRVG